MLAFSNCRLGEMKSELLSFVLNHMQPQGARDVKLPILGSAPHSERFVPCPYCLIRDDETER